MLFGSSPASRQELLVRRAGRVKVAATSTETPLKILKKTSVGPSPTGDTPDPRDNPPLTPHEQDAARKGLKFDEAGSRL